MVAPARPPEIDPQVFAALGDPTRLALVTRLRGQPGLSTTALAADTDITRQAVAKHLRVLEGAGLVEASRRGRERLWRLDAAPLRDVAAWAEEFRALWEARFDRLESYLDRAEGPEET